MAKRKNPDFERDMELLLTEEGFDNKALLSEIIEILQNFCQDNILALTPLLQTEEENTAVQERICYFSIISKLLDGIASLSETDVVFSPAGKETKKKKKASGKKHKKEKRD